MYRIGRARHEHECGDREDHESEERRGTPGPGPHEQGARTAQDLLDPNDHGQSNP